MSKLAPVITPLELISPDAVMWPVKCDLPSISKSPVAERSPLELMFPEAVTLVVLTFAIVPKVAVPVVVMAPDPTSIEVNPEVIDPAFNAPTVTMFACPVIGANASFIRVLP